MESADDNSVICDLSLDSKNDFQTSSETGIGSTTLDFIVSDIAALMPSGDEFSSSFESVADSFWSTDEGFHNVSPIRCIYSPRRSRPFPYHPSFGEIELSLLTALAHNARCGRNSTLVSKSLKDCLDDLYRPHDKGS